MRNPIIITLVLASALQAQQYTREGKLVLPKNYRSWTFLASGLGMTYKEEGEPKGEPLFANIFVQPAAYREFLRHGIWPDKTILLEEVRGAGQDPSVNKDGRFQTGVTGLDVHVKDSSRGGWAFYFIANGQSSGRAFPRTASCFTCHEQHGATDTTFVQYYPTLIEAARTHGTYKEPKD